MPLVGHPSHLSHVNVRLSAWLNYRIRLSKAKRPTIWYSNYKDRMFKQRTIIAVKRRACWLQRNLSFDDLFCTLIVYLIYTICHETSDIRRVLVGKKLVDLSDVVGASPVGVDPTTSSFSTYHLASMDWAKTTTRWDENNLSFVIWCGLY